MEKNDYKMPPSFVVNTDSKELHISAGDATVPIANFVPIVKSVERIFSDCTDASDPPLHLRIILAAHLIGCKAISKECVITLEDLRRFDFQSVLDSRCLVFSGKTGLFYIEHFIRQVVADTPVKDRLLLTRIGFQSFREMRFFVAGSHVIGHPGIDLEFAPQLRSFQLETQPMGDSVQCYIRKLVQLCLPHTAVMFAFLITGLLRSAFEDAGVKIKFCLFLFGQTQSFKTTLLQLFFQIFNRESSPEYGFHNFTGTPAKLHQFLEAERDIVTVIDDLNLSDSQREIRRQNALASEIIRIAANGIGRQTMHHDFSVNSVVAFAGEYLLANASTNNRLIILDLQSAGIDKKELSALQAEPRALSSFVNDFISWLLQNYSETTDSIKNEMLHYKESRAGQERYQERLQESASVLHCSFGVFLAYCKSRNVMAPLDIDHFEKLLTGVIYDQIDMLNLDGEPERDYVYEFYEIFQIHKDLSGNIKKLDNLAIRQDVFLDKHTGLLFIPSGVFTKLVAQSDFNITPRDLIKSFQDLGLLEMDKNRQGSKTKKKKGIRCYVVHYYEWKEYVREVAFKDEET